MTRRVWAPDRSELGCSLVGVRMKGEGGAEEAAAVKMVILVVVLFRSQFVLFCCCYGIEMFLWRYRNYSKRDMKRALSRKQNGLLTSYRIQYEQHLYTMKYSTNRFSVQIEPGDCYFRLHRL